MPPANRGATRGLPGRAPPPSESFRTLSGTAPEDFRFMRYLLDPTNWDTSYSDSIPELLAAHIGITLATLVIALLIAFPIALLIARYERLYLPVITAAGVLYTIPSIAAFALLIPVTGLTAATVLIPLVIYAQIVLIRNIVAGLHAVDPTLIDVGHAMGMDSRQTLLRVTLPLALPVILAGVRIATVTTIGVATIAPEVGVKNLGYLITQGLAFDYKDQVVAGAILATALALLADLGLLLLQRALDRGRTSVGAAA